MLSLRVDDRVKLFCGKSGLAKFGFDQIIFIMTLSGMPWTRHDKHWWSLSILLRTSIIVLGRCSMSFRSFTISITFISLHWMSVAASQHQSVTCSTVMILRFQTDKPGKQCRPRSDCSSGSTRFAIRSASFGLITLWQSHSVRFLG